jgi:hypothetical protein
VAAWWSGGLGTLTPQGDAADATRDPATVDAIAVFLLACGAEPLDTVRPDVLEAPMATLL